MRFCLLAVLCVLTVDNGGFLLLSNGGITSSFVRDEERSIDMPFDSDVFRVPPGYNQERIGLTTPNTIGFVYIYNH
ncbi:hypothetical protein L1987_39947 [Smallanthus sonchifolius]|uniref:Uncharacterized protein n=1 Tax=Smallanthus sonchifolius TaxID=185202 RepID=A0ACB9GTC4_9ASTR|nr:hypothetical protein L1987_39947 [Smallanthus sonchifolius]